jgi:hypothetical protein
MFHCDPRSHMFNPLCSNPWVCRVVPRVLATQNPLTFIVYLSCHFGVGLFHVIGHGGTPLVVLNDMHILTMTIALLGTLSKVA